jgi:hypothetical protein
MPIIKLEGTPDDAARVVALMLFPNNKELQERYFTVNKVKGYLAELHKTLDSYGSTSSLFNKTIIELDAYSLTLLLEAPSDSEMKMLVADSTKRAIIAGDILSAIYIMYKSGIEEPSINKAIHVTQEYAKAKETKYGDGTRLPISERYIREYWREFLPVAHFWAAFRLNQSIPYVEEKLFESDGFDLFMRVSQGIYGFGTNYIPKRAKPKTPILNINDSWQIPSNFKAMDLTNASPPDKLVKFLKNYFAPQAAY